MSKPLLTDDQFQMFARIEERLRRIETSNPAIIRGEINAAGSITRGSGFTVAKPGTGDYTVTFDNAFESIPVVVVCAGATAGDIVAKLNSAAAPSTTSFRVDTFTTTTGASVDSIFDFIVVTV